MSCRDIVASVKDPDEALYVLGGWLGSVVIFVSPWKALRCCKVLDALDNRLIIVMERGLLRLKLAVLDFSESLSSLVCRLMSLFLAFGALVRVVRR